MIELVESNSLYGTLIFDVSAILIVLVFMIVNTKRGFSKIFISVIGYILAIIVGSAIGDISAESIYDSVIKAQNVKEIQDVLDDCDVATSIHDRIKKDTYGVNISEDKLKKIISSPDKVYKTINTDGAEMFSKDAIVLLIAESIEDELSEPLKNFLPVSAVDYMMNSMKTDSNTLYSTASVLLQDDTEPAKYIDETFVKPIVVYIIKMAIFFALFFIVMIVVKLISKTIENNNSDTINMSNSTDRILGAVMGIIEGCVFLILIAVILKWLVFTSADTSAILNDSIIQDTKLFKYIYNIDTLKFIN